MSYTITIYDTAGDHTVAAADKATCEHIVKAYIYAQVMAWNYAFGDVKAGGWESQAALDASKALEMELRGDLLEGAMHSMDLDGLVGKLSTVCGWDHGAFNIDRRENY